MTLEKIWPYQTSWTCLGFDFLTYKLFSFGVLFVKIAQRRPFFKRNWKRKKNKAYPENIKWDEISNELNCTS